MLILKDSATQNLVFLMVDSTDHITGKTGLSPTVTLSKNGATFASPAGSVSEVGNGWYMVAAHATDSNTFGPLALHATATGADPVDMLYYVVAFNPQDAAALGLSRLDAAVSTRSTYAGGDTAGTTTLLSRIPDTLSLANINAQADQALADYDAPTKAEMDAALASLQSHGDSEWSTVDLTTLQADVDAIGAILTAVTEDVSGVRFTEHALSEAPTGSGGGGDATEANQTLILAALAALETHGDSTWATAAGFATPTNVSDATTTITNAIGALPAPGDATAANQTLILEAVGELSGSGAGATQVNHDFGGSDALAYYHDDVPVDNAEILVYLTSDFDAGNTGRSYVIASSRTNVLGQWIQPVMLDPGSYTIQFFKQGSFGPDTAEITVT